MTDDARWLNEWAARESARNDQTCPDCEHPHLPMLAPYRLETGRLVVQKCGWPTGPEPCECVRLS